MKITPAQMKRLHQLLNACRLIDDKADLVYTYSNGNATSSKDLLESEARALIQHLEVIAQQMLPAAKPVEYPGDLQRKKIISMAHEMRWKLGNGAADMARINAWCAEKGFGKKPLNYYTEAELPRLVSQFKIVYEKHIADMAAGK